MSAPIFRDPVYDGATDPTVIRDRQNGDWWMFYTQRRTTDHGEGVRWIHGTSIGIAISSDDGTTWRYLGIAEGLGQGDTLWAPEVIATETDYRMYLTVVDGIPDSWTGAPAHIVEFVSDDLLHWTRVGQIELESDRVIDAAVARCGDGQWRLWYKNETDGSSTWSAVSPDMRSWRVEGRAVPASPPHEGPNVFQLGGCFWMITDEWRGLGVHQSAEGLNWKRQDANDGLILDSPGTHPDDHAIGHHADGVLVASDADPAVILFYFPHPQTDPSNPMASRISAVHAARLVVRDGHLVADRNITTAQLLLCAAESERTR